jgi:hypothetical protein
VSSSATVFASPRGLAEMRMPSSLKSILNTMSQPAAKK